MTSLLRRRQVFEVGPGSGGIKVNGKQVKLDAALRLLHTHLLGIGVLILLTTLAIANL